jgi:hypothetical protein
LGVSSGSRSRAIGFVLEACRTLLEAEGGGSDVQSPDGEKRHTEVIKALEVRHDFMKDYMRHEKSVMGSTLEIEMGEVL